VFYDGAGRGAIGPPPFTEWFRWLGAAGICHPGAIVEPSFWRDDTPRAACIGRALWLRALAEATTAGVTGAEAVSRKGQRDDAAGGFRCEHGCPISGSSDPASHRSGMLLAAVSSASGFGVRRCRSRFTLRRARG
jgi:hypothetical protein